MNFLRTKRFHRILDCIILLSIVSFLCALYCSANIEPETQEYPNSVYKTIYIDRQFSPEERQGIIKAAEEWSKATDNIVQYEIVEFPTDEEIDWENCLFFSKISEDHPTVVLSDFVDGVNIYAYYSKSSGIPTISVIDGRIPDEHFKSVMMHEIGHSLGLDHVSTIDDIGALMYPYVYIEIDGIRIPVAPNEITENDIEHFCELYHCDANQLSK